jgi:uncharacterized protein (TIGR02266 family)
MTEDSKESKKIDRRRHLRAPLIVLKIKLEDEKKVFFGYAKNLSKSGMFIASVNPHEPGTVFDVEFPLPDDSEKTVRCRCKVIWQRRYTHGSTQEPGMGLRFIDLSREAAKIIDAWASANQEE